MLAVVFDFNLYPVPQSKAKSIGDVLMDRQNAKIHKIKDDRKQTNKSRSPRSETYCERSPPSVPPFFLITDYTFKVAGTYAVAVVPGVAGTHAVAGSNAIAAFLLLLSNTCRCYGAPAVASDPAVLTVADDPFACSPLLELEICDGFFPMA
jgi:hypothetical protein